MNERTSKRLLFIEAIVFFAPVSMVTLLYSLMLISMYRSGLGREPLEAHAVPVFTFLGLGLQLCGWRVIAAFLIDGRDGLRRVPRPYIYAIHTGAMLVALSGLVVLLMILGVELPESFGLLSANYLALPALVPFMHVVAEMRMLQRTNATSGI
jgi:hypothetical protein